MRGKRTALFLMGALGAVVSIGTLGFPAQRRSQTTLEGQRLTTQTYERKWELLPLSQWSLLPCEIHGCGSNGGSTIRQLPFLFIALTETSESWSYVTAEQRSSPPSQGKEP